MKLGEIRVGADKRVYKQSIELYFWRSIKQFETQHFNGSKWVVVPEGIAQGPSFDISESEAQHLMDSLWNCGLRPTEGKGSAGSLKATEKHLDDMRRIAFGLLNDWKAD